MPSSDSAPYNGDYKLYGRETRAYMRYGWTEIRANREPADVEQWPAPPLRPQDGRSPYRIYADAVMNKLIPRYAPDPLSVIDIGCGGGSYAQLFQDRTGTYHGVDAFSYVTWDAIEDQAEDWPLRVQLHRHPAEALDELPIQANFSLSSSALEHVDDPDAAIRALAQVTEVGAYGLHIVPGPWSLLTYGKHGWRRFSAIRLRALFEAAGFECITLYRLGGTPSTLVHLFWLTGVQDGYALQNLTRGALPFWVYQLNRQLRLPNLRSIRLATATYRAWLRLALRLDRFFPTMASGYAILVRRTASLADSTS